MSIPASKMNTETLPAFTQGIKFFAPESPELTAGAEPVIAEGQTAINKIDDAAVYQTLLGADALRYLTLQVCSSKESGHPGGFASSADAYAALVMLGHTNIVTEVGHHAPGFYSAMFLDSSLEEMNIHTMDDMMARFMDCSDICPVPYRVCWHRPVRWVRASTSPWRVPICTRTNCFHSPSVTAAWASPMCCRP